MLFTLATFFVAGDFVSVARGSEAKILLESVDNKTIYKLNQDILEKISQLEGPIRVVAAIGNARVGKSTTLNLISHVWSGKNETSAVEEIFKTGHSHGAVTRNVWAHIIKPNENGSIVLLDVEGTDLGDDRVTDRLSMFTATMSSALNLFALNIVRNGDIDFLYRIVRLSDLVFEDGYVLPNFPKLRIVLRSELDRPDDEKIRDEIFKRGREKAQIIQKYFPRSTIEESHIPTVGRKLLKDPKKLSKSDWEAFLSLAKDLQNSPEKRSFEGSLIDGTSFKQLAEEAVEAMNSDDSWKGFGDVYAALERDICRRTYEKRIKPVVMQSSKEIGEKMMEALDDFRKECVLEDEIKNAREELKVTLREKREREDEERQRQEEENRRREEEKRRRIQEEDRRREEEKRRRIQEEDRRTEEKKRRRIQEEENKWEPYWTYVKYTATVTITGTIAGFVGYMISDQNLKNDVTILLHSEYNDIGLRGVCWKWNEDAKESFGLTGEDCGVIAQEVRMLYPWAVLQGKDGYLRVQYHMLREMIYVVHNGGHSTCM